MSQSIRDEVSTVRERASASGVRRLGGRAGLQPARAGGGVFEGGLKPALLGKIVRTHRAVAGAALCRDGISGALNRGVKPLLQGQTLDGEFFRAAPPARAYPSGSRFIQARRSEELIAFSAS